MNAHYTMNEVLHVIQITPLIHYTMGGIEINNKSEVINESGKPINGLFAAGETAGGVHGANRLGGTSLLDCVVYGRVAGRSACKYLLNESINNLQAVQKGNKPVLP